MAIARASHFASFEGHGLASEPKLISQSVHLKEIPTKIIKVTKTAIVKVPVPYPVKVLIQLLLLFFVLLLLTIFDMKIHGN